ncbi:IS66 family transposase [Bradyrhizobium sp. USDA 4518]
MLTSSTDVLLTGFKHPHLGTIDAVGGVHSIGYAAYKAPARGHGDAIQLAFCLAHARRKLVEVCKTMSRCSLTN